MKIKYTVEQEVEIVIENPAKAMAHAAAIKPDDAGVETPWQSLLRCTGTTAELCSGRVCALKHDDDDKFGPLTITASEPIISDIKIATDDGRPLVCTRDGKFYELRENGKKKENTCEMCDAKFDAQICNQLCGCGYLPIKSRNYWCEVQL